MEKERIVMAVPFYTRLWAEQIVDGEVKLSSKALGMDDAKKELASNKVTAQFDEASGQNYAEYKKDGITYKIWMEDIQAAEAINKAIAEKGSARILLSTGASQFPFFDEFVKQKMEVCV